MVGVVNIQRVLLANRSVMCGHDLTTRDRDWG